MIISGAHFLRQSRIPVRNRITGKLRDPPLRVIKNPYRREVWF